MNITGLPNTGMTAFDQQIISVLTRYQVPGATVAVSRNGRVIIARGYGLLDSNDPNSRTMPANRFRIASVSKPITAMTILALIEAGRLTLDTNVWKLLSPKYPLLPGRSLTSGIDQITVRQLLNHTAGWDNNLYDPMFQVDQIAQQVGVPAPADRATIIRYMWSHPLAHPPGSQYSYANFHYCLLGRVIEEITGRAYADYVSSDTFFRMNVVSTAQGASLLPGRLLEEAMYFDYPGAPLVTSVFPPFDLVPEPYGGFDLENMDSHGGWVSSTIGLLAFMEVLFEGNFLNPATKNEVIANRVPSDSTGNHFYGLGWALTAAGTSFNWWHNGSLPGTTSIIVHTTWSDGSDVCWAALLNSRDQAENINGDLDNGIWAAIQALNSLPDPIFPVAWQARHGLDPNGYQATFDHLVSQGYRLVHVDGCGVNSGARYSAIWEQSPGPDWQAHHGLTASQYQQTFDSLVAQGYRLRVVSGYVVGGVDLYAAIWDKGGPTEWEAHHRLTAIEYQETFDQIVWGKGYQLVDVSGYEVGGKVMYAAIWETR